MEAIRKDFYNLYQAWDGEQTPAWRFKDLVGEMLYYNFEINNTKMHVGAEHIWNLNKISDSIFTLRVEARSNPDRWEDWKVDVQNKKVEIINQHSEFEDNKSEEREKEWERKKKKNQFFEDLELDPGKYPLESLSTSIGKDSYMAERDQYFTFYDTKEDEMVYLYKDRSSYEAMGGSDADVAEWDEKNEMIENNPDRFIKVPGTSHGEWHSRFRSWLSDKGLSEEYVGSIGKTLRELPYETQNDWTSRQGELSRRDAKEFVFKHSNSMEDRECEYLK